MENLPGCGWAINGLTIYSPSGRRCQSTKQQFSVTGIAGAIVHVLTFLILP